MPEAFPVVDPPMRYRRVAPYNRAADTATTVRENPKRTVYMKDSNAAPINPGPVLRKSIPRPGGR